MTDEPKAKHTETLLQTDDATNIDLRCTATKDVVMSLLVVGVVKDEQPVLDAIFRITGVVMPHEEIISRGLPCEINGRRYRLKVEEE